MFTGKLDEDVEIIAELIRGIPPSHRNRCKYAAAHMENAFMQLKKDYPKDPAVLLGAAYGVFKIAEHLVQKARDKSPENTNLIQLLS